MPFNKEIKPEKMMLYIWASDFGDIHKIINNITDELKNAETEVVFTKTRDKQFIEW